MTVLQKQNLRISVETHKTQIVKSSLRKYKGGGIVLPDFKLCHKVTDILIVWCWQKIKKDT